MMECWLFIQVLLKWKCGVVFCVILTQGNVKKSEYANKLIFKSAQHPPILWGNDGSCFVYLPHSTTKRFLLKTLKPKEFNPHTFFSSSFQSPKNCLFVQAHNLIKVIPIHGEAKKSSWETSFCRLDFSITNKNSNFHLWKYSDIYGTVKTT